MKSNGAVLERADVHYTKEWKGRFNKGRLKKEDKQKRLIKGLICIISLNTRIKGKE